MPRPFAPSCSPLQVRVAAGMAQDDRQAQAQQLLHERRVLEIGFQLAQLAAMAEHQQAEPVQFGLRETGRIGIVQDVRAVLVVVAVRDAAADLVQLRRPAQLALLARQFSRVAGRVELAQQGAGDFPHPARLRRVRAELGGQPLHRRAADVGFSMLAVQQVVQDAMAQCALGCLHLLDLQQVEQRQQHAQAAADHGAPVFLQALELHPVGAARGQQLLLQPVQPVTGDAAALPARGAEDVAHRADRPRRAVRHIPLARGRRR